MTIMRKISILKKIANLIENNWNDEEKIFSFTDMHLIKMNSSNQGIIKMQLLFIV